MDEGEQGTEGVDLLGALRGQETDDQGHGERKVYELEVALVTEETRDKER